MAKGDGNQHFKNGVKNLTERERFLNKIKINEYTQCWEWQGFKNKQGYGHFNGGGQVLAHRFSYILYIGDIPPKMQICHKCDNNKCVSPFHFFLGTNSDNQKDAQNKGRIPKTKHPSSVSYKNGCRCELCRRFLNYTNKLSAMKRKGIFNGKEFERVESVIKTLKDNATFV